ncbi:MAG TPA: hypothetical protein VME43_32825 [Bryobacteraceae bacterium]|nr:hypothetical protein [Bryobacteraceae bacterium]
MKHSLLFTFTAVLAIGTAAYAQKSEVGKRAENQQQRIAQGVKSGSLTARGTANLETKEAAINHEVKADRSADGGKLTGQEKKTVNQQQNHLSKQIYTDKHNAARQNYGKSEVGQRQTNQQQRIGNGIASGKLSAGKAARLENGEAGVNQEVRADRQANGGKLTTGEKQQVNQQQNQLGGRIYNAKH